MATSKERDIITSHNASSSLYIMINLKQNGNYSEAKYQFSSSQLSGRQKWLQISSMEERLAQMTSVHVQHELVHSP